MNSVIHYWKKIIVGCFLIGLLAIVGYEWIEATRVDTIRNSFQRIQVGQTKGQITDVLGKPSEITDCKNEALRPDYKEKCAEIYWYSGGFGRWIVYFDKSGYVIYKTEEVSP